ncbi:unnamed protein product, partial [Amoebophrya sp. A120]|eukprot:GSA120T00012463001.1
MVRCTSTALRQPRGCRMKSCSRRTHQTARIRSESGDYTFLCRDTNAFPEVDQKSPQGVEGAALASNKDGGEDQFRNTNTSLGKASSTGSKVHRGARTTSKEAEQNQASTFKASSSNKSPLSTATSFFQKNK